MPNKKYFSYIRVSTQRQGQLGTSLTEQQAAIDNYARNWDLKIVRHFEERQTAAKQGRPIFLEMLKELKQRRAHGVVIHKIDRSARNLKDWSDLGALIDLGIEVHFAAESLDLSSRGGRLSADIQAVVAADFIRNLREEAKKGIYGRLKQGLYPFMAVVGYLDRGSGQPKAIDPVKGPLVRQAFELYTSGDWGLLSLAAKMYDLGLRGRGGSKITRNGLANILHNPFYMGVIHIKKNGQSFAGIHEPIVSSALFKRVHDIFAGKAFKTEKRHFFEFRRMITCTDCGRLMTPETQKKRFTYYRCHERNCQTTCLKEQSITDEMLRILRQLKFSDKEYELLMEIAREQGTRHADEAEIKRAELALRQGLIKDRSSRLADAFVDRVFDETTYLQKKNELIAEEVELKQQIQELSENGEKVANLAQQMFELANSAYLSYKSATPQDRRDLAKILTSNFTSDGKSVVIKLKKPFEMIAARDGVTGGSPHRAALRHLFSQVWEVLKKNDDLKLVVANQDLSLEP
jgi:site-specific DNA recombinase